MSYADTFVPSLWLCGIHVHVCVPVHVRVHVRLKTPLLQQHCTKLAEPIECPMVGSLLALVVLPASVRGYHARGDGWDSLSVDTPSHSVCSGLQRLMACACCCGGGDHVSRRVVMPPNTTRPFRVGARPSTWYM